MTMKRASNTAQQGEGMHLQRRGEESGAERARYTHTNNTHAHTQTYRTADTTDPPGAGRQGGEPAPSTGDPNAQYAFCLWPFAHACVGTTQKALLNPSSILNQKSISAPRDMRYARCMCLCIVRRVYIARFVERRPGPREPLDEYEYDLTISG